MKKPKYGGLSKEHQEKQREYDKFLEIESQKFHLTPEDLHNLFDLDNMIYDSRLENVLRLNKMYKWYQKFFNKIDKLVLVDLNRVNTKSKSQESSGKL